MPDVCPCPGWGSLGSAQTLYRKSFPLQGRPDGLKIYRRVHLVLPRLWLTPVAFTSGKASSVRHVGAYWLGTPQTLYHKVFP